MSDPIVRVLDLAFVRYRTPDLAEMETFLLAFGMQVAHRSDSHLYMRGTEPSHYIYVTELSDGPGFIGPAFEVESADDLERLSKELDGASAVSDLQGPGGGQHVTAIDPGGYQVEFVHGIAPLPEIPVRDALVHNTDRRRTRKGEFQRPSQGPAHVRRIGHLIMRTAHFEETVNYYKQFGFSITDSTHDPDDEKNLMVAFMKCGRGKEWTDHHTVGFARREPVAVDHTAYECIDLDDVVMGGRHLEQLGYKRSWGVGRHILGSQIFDYWRDPNGFKVEHWTDGDLVNEDTPRTNVPAGDVGPGAISQWSNIPEDYLKVYPNARAIGPKS
jgi:catechol 2,3-dioxygenase-like lactoylglutathione lyase family enzyme